MKRLIGTWQEKAALKFKEPWHTALPRFSSSLARAAPKHSERLAGLAGSAKPRLTLQSLHSSSRGAAPAGLQQPGLTPQGHWGVSAAGEMASGYIAGGFPTLASSQSEISGGREGGSMAGACSRLSFQN